MPFDISNPGRVAIVGAGVSGLAAAYELSKTQRVTLFESAPRLGGHARTVMAGPDAATPVDTGFIVFNYPNYPHLTRMFAELDVPTKPSNMSFSASIANGAIEYGLNNFAALTAQSRNMLRPQFWRMIADIAKFNRHGPAMACDPDLSLGEFLDRMNLGTWFRRYYLLPLSGAIWSSTPEQMRDFPARSLIQFFQNHALMSYKNHQWHTVDGGSIQYVTRIADAIQSNGSIIRENAPVRGVRRTADNVAIRTKGGEWEKFDAVIMACHSDDALKLLEQPSPAEQSILGRMRYQTNRAVLHRDPSAMPRRRACWASWVFTSPDHKPSPTIGVTYWMNSLQGIADDTPMFMSLNPVADIAPEYVYDRTEFRHPIFDHVAIRAQQALPGIQGQQNTWYCGAYTRWGFHEDGYASGMSAATAIAARRERVAA